MQSAQTLGIDQPVQRSGARKNKQPTLFSSFIRKSEEIFGNNFGNG
jgi:hypothetical protein